MKKTLFCCLLFALSLLTGCSLLIEDTTYVEEGMAAIESGSYDEAIRLFQTSIDENHSLVESYRGQGIAYMGQEDYDNAVTCFDKAVDLTKDSQSDVRQDILLYKATALYRLKDYTSAVKVCDTIQAIRSNADAYYLRGLCYMELDETEKAKVDFDTAVKIEPNDYDMLLNIYECYNAKSLSAEGDTYLQQALSIDSDEDEDAYQKARIYFYLEDYDSAAEQLRALVNARDQRAMLLMGEVYMKQDDIAHARQMYEQYLSEYGESAEVYNGLALCDMAEGGYDDALEHIAQGLALPGESGDQDLYFNEIVVYEEKLDFATAKEKAKAYVAAYPTDEEGQKEYTFLCSRVE